MGETHGPCSAVAVPGPFTEPISLFGTTHGATTSSIHCNSESLDGPTTWYSIAPVAGSQVTVSSPHTHFDTIIAVYNGNNCNALSCVTVSDDSGQTQFIATSELYYIAVTGYNGASGKQDSKFPQ
jgi:hypothetical protein